MNDRFENLNFTLAVTALVNFLADQLTDEELELLSAVLTQAADTMSTILTLRSNRSETNTEAEEIT